MRGLSFGLGLGETGALRRVAGNNLAYAIGDSRTRATASPAGSYNQRYPLTVARQLCAGQMDLPYPNIQGVGGYTVQQIYDNLFAGALASAADTLIVLAGTNSLGSSPAANAAIIGTMATAWTDSSPTRVIHILDEVPWGGTDGDEAGHQALRDGIRALSDPAGGINIVGAWRAITGGDDGITPLSDSYRDGLHFAIPGAIRVGRALAASLLSALPKRDFHGQATALAQSFALGTLAASDMASNSTLSAGSVGTSMVTHEGEAWLQVVLTGAIGSINVYRSSTAIPGGWVAGTTLLESNIDFILRPGHTNLRRLGLFAMKQSGTSNPHYSTAVGAGDGEVSPNVDDAIDLGYPDGTELRGTLWTPRLRLAADATQLRPWWVTLSSRTALAADATLLFRRPQCRVVS